MVVKLKLTEAKASSSIPCSLQHMKTCLIIVLRKAGMTDLSNLRVLLEYVRKFTWDGLAGHGPVKSKNWLALAHIESRPHFGGYRGSLEEEKIRKRGRLSHPSAQSSTSSQNKRPRGHSLNQSFLFSHTKNNKVRPVSQAKGMACQSEPSNDGFWGTLF